MFRVCVRSFARIPPPDASTFFFAEEITFDNGEHVVLIGHLRASILRHRG